MTNSEKMALWNPVRNRFCGASNTGNGCAGSKELASLLQTYEFDNWYNDDRYPMSEKLKHQLTLLDGPYAETVFKMLLARRGQKS